MKYDRRRRPKHKGKKKQACEKKGPRGLPGVPDVITREAFHRKTEILVLPFAKKDLYRTFLRFTTEEESARGFQWHDGVNIDFREFDRVGSCCEGGLYFTDTQYACEYLSSSADQDFYWVRQVYPDIDDTHSFVMDPDKRFGYRKWRSKKVFSYPRRRLTDISTWKWMCGLVGMDSYSLMGKSFYVYAFHNPELLISRRRELATPWVEILEGVLRAARMERGPLYRLRKVLTYLAENAAGGFPWRALDKVLSGERYKDACVKELHEFRGGLFKRLSRTLLSFFSQKTVDDVRMLVAHMYTSVNPK